MYNTATVRKWSCAAKRVSTTVSPAGGSKTTPNCSAAQHRSAGYDDRTFPRLQQCGEDEEGCLLLKDLRTEPTVILWNAVCLLYLLMTHRFLCAWMAGCATSPPTGGGTSTDSSRCHPGGLRSCQFYDCLFVCLRVCLFVYSVHIHFTNTYLHPLLLQVTMGLTLFLFSLLSAGVGQGSFLREVYAANRYAGCNTGKSYYNELTLLICFSRKSFDFIPMPHFGENQRFNSNFQKKNFFFVLKRWLCYSDGVTAATKRHRPAYFTLSVLVSAIWQGKIRMWSPQRPECGAWERKI